MHCDHIFKPDNLPRRGRAVRDHRHGRHRLRPNMAMMSNAKGWFFPYMTTPSTIRGDFSVGKEGCCQHKQRTPPLRAAAKKRCKSRVLKERRLTVTSMDMHTHLHHSLTLATEPKAISAVEAAKPTRKRGCTVDAEEQGQFS
ncbi:hypothetical protein PHBOTO_004049 [Pseudozyma hubeiensis]|nr:hypothetical protein PHBOTO_004049 [Pseudozyma hubeiensis]